MPNDSASSQLPTRRIGPLTVSALGLGCMGMTLAYGRADKDRSIATLHHALDRGITLFDTADLYGKGANERLVGQALRSRPEGVVLATKVGLIPSLTGVPKGVDGSPAHIRRAVERSLERLGVDTIDLLYLHRVDPRVPIEESVGAMAELVRAGKVDQIGLSEPSGDTIRRAAAVHPIAAVQSEWSLFSRDLEAEVVPAAREVGATLVPYSPLGRGMLTEGAGRIRLLDFRRTLPRWQGRNLEHNRAVVEVITAEAARLEMTTAQLALAWLLARGEDVVPIPGTTRPARLDENVAAAMMTVPAETLDRLSELRAAGGRYRDLEAVRGETPPADGS